MQQSLLYNVRKTKTAIAYEVCSFVQFFNAWNSSGFDINRLIGQVHGEHIIIRDSMARRWECVHRDQRPFLEMIDHSRISLNPDTLLLT